VAAIKPMHMAGYIELLGLEKPKGWASPNVALATVAERPRRRLTETVTRFESYMPPQAFTIRFPHHSRSADR